MKRVFIILLLLVQYSFAWGQTDIPLTKCEAFMPRAILDNMILKESIVNNFMADPTYGQVGKEPSSKKYWIVYSDRADNNTYVAPGSTRVYKTLGWNEPLRIARISGKYALVYVEPNKKVKWPKISPDAICMGWIPMDHLLLWDTCLADDKGILVIGLCSAGDSCFAGDNVIYQCTPIHNDHTGFFQCLNGGTPFIRDGVNTVLDKKNKFNVGVCFAEQFHQRLAFS